MINPYSEQERIAAMISACLRASRTHFNHLAIRDVINPPRDLPDAQLARQIAVHILEVEYQIPRRRLVKLMGMARTTVLGAMRTVDWRLQEPVFERAYVRIAARSKDLFMAALHEAATDQEDAA